MHGPTRPCWRWLRAGTFSAVAAQLCVVGHLWGGGQLPDLPLVGVLTVLLAFVMSGLGRHRGRFRVLLPTMLIAQLAFHLALTLDTHAHVSVDPLRMAAFHLVAAAIGAAVFADGDRLLFRLASWFTRLLPTAYRPVVGPQSAAAVALPAPATSVPAPNWRRPPRRGPPRSIAFA